MVCDPEVTAAIVRSLCQMQARLVLGLHQENLPGPISTN